MASGDFYYAGGSIEVSIDIQFEAIKMSAIAIGVSLGLTGEQLTTFGALAYSKTRGKTIVDAYESLVRLAYNIKTAE